MSILEFLVRNFVFNRNLPAGAKITRNINYSDMGMMDIYTPEKISGQLPILIYIHGGGWTTGSKLTTTRQCVTISREGYLVISVKYRLGPQYTHPAQLEDITLVLKWLINNKDKYNANINRIFFGGSSAGAHLACLSVCVATNNKLMERIGLEFPVTGSQIAGSILISGGYNMENIVDSGFFMIRTMVQSYTGTRNPSEYKYKDQISPVHHITEEFPPAFIAAGGRDKLFGQSIELIDELDKKERPYDKLLFDKNMKCAKHAFLHYYYKECSKQTYKGIIEFMNKYSF